MNHRFWNYLICLLCLTFSFSANDLTAQRSGYVSAGLGTGMYFGDISDSWTNNEFHPSATIQAGMYVAPGVSIRGVFTQGTVGAADGAASSEARWNRNLSFRTSISELQAGVVYEFLEDKTFRQRWKRNIHISPIVFAGVAGMYMNPKAYYEGTWVDLQPLGTEGQYLPDHAEGPYSRFQVSIPAGIGVTVRLPERVSIWAEVGYRKTFTDYLDDVSTTYPDLQELAKVSGPLAASLSDRSSETFAAGSLRGNPGAKDAFAFFSVGVGYFFGR